MTISYMTLGVKLPSIKRKNTTNWIKQIILDFQKNIGDITYIFCSDREILRINLIYLKHYYYTDIVTFDYSEGNLVSGDLFISLDTVKYNAERFRSSYLKELHRVIIHGILHLCGLKDQLRKEKIFMRLRENQALKNYDVSL